MHNSITVRSKFLYLSWYINFNEIQKIFFKSQIYAVTLHFIYYILVHINSYHLLAMSVFLVTVSVACQVKLGSEGDRTRVGYVFNTHLQAFQGLLKHCDKQFFVQMQIIWH